MQEKKETETERYKYEAEKQERYERETVQLFRMKQYELWWNSKKRQSEV